MHMQIANTEFQLPSMMYLKITLIEYTLTNSQNPDLGIFGSCELGGERKKK